MPYAPAICSSHECRNVFPSGFFISNSRDITIGRNQCGECPICGSISFTAAGIYNDILESFVAEINQMGDYSALSRAQEILYAAIENNSTDNVLDELKKQIPTLSSFLQSLGDPKIHGLLMLLTLLVVVIQMAMDNFSSAESDSTQRLFEIRNEAVIENLYSFPASQQPHDL